MSAPTIEECIVGIESYIVCQGSVLPELHAYLPLPLGAAAETIRILRAVQDDPGWARENSINVGEEGR
jgi:hypothetical protein